MAYLIKAEVPWELRGRNHEDLLRNRSIWQQKRSLLLSMLFAAFFILATTGCGTTPGTECGSDSFLVTTTEDIFDGVCNDHCSLRDAVNAANTCTAREHYSIELPAGTYTLSLRGPDENRGDINILRSASVIGASSATTFIQGNTTWNNRILTVEEGADLNLEGITISNGDLNIGIGGGILNLGILTITDVGIENNESMLGGGLFNAGSATLDQVWFTGNEAKSPPLLSEAEVQIYTDTRFSNDCGGGFTNTGSMVLSNSIVEENRAGDGGGVCNGGRGTLTIRQSLIQNNSGTINANIEGGGIYNSGNLTLENSWVRSNMAYTGGGIFQGGARGEGFDDSDSGHLTLDNVTVEQNTAQPISTGDGLGLGEGGGLYLSGGEFAIHNSLIIDNRAGTDGGGIYLASSGVITQTSIARNFASIDARPVGKGGGIYVSGNPVELTNVTISSNNAGESGGAAYIAGGTIHLSHVTIANNTGHGPAPFGGLHMIGGHIIFENSMLVLNQFGSCRFLGGTSETRGFNIQEGNLCRFVRTQVRDGLEVIFPELSTAADGQLVHFLVPTGLAVDHAEGACPAEDQLGVARPQGERCDVGAYELELQVLSAPNPQTGPATATPTPESKPNVLTRDALCWEGPGSVYNVVSSVRAGTPVLLLGRGQVGVWWIIDNPRFPGVACWLPGDALDVDPDLVFADLQVFKAPPIPTPTPTPVLGCLYKGPNDNQAICYPIAQCPVPFSQSQGACSP